MVDRLQSKRILIYSHDTFGLGHLRRCRTIAHSLVERFKGLTCLIVSGSPLIADFDFKARVDFIRVPGVIKLYNGEYTSLKLHIDIQDTLSIRESIIRHTARSFNPDIFLVDKEPLGLKGEVYNTLDVLKSAGTRLVLGLRDVMDEPSRLQNEWSKRPVFKAMEELYDDIWVYGPEGFVDPLAGLEMAPAIRDKMSYMGFLPRPLPRADHLPPTLDTDDPYLLVTPGGGGDGAAMVDWVMRAYEEDHALPYRAIMVLGPFMPLEDRENFIERAEKLDDVTVLTFEPQMELLTANAEAVVAMTGYNTFCELLSYDKKALLIPRTEPRREQLIRATRAFDMGMFNMLVPDDGLDTQVMVDAIRRLPDQAKPSQALTPGALSGLDTIGSIVRERLGGDIDQDVDIAATNDRDEPETGGSGDDDLDEALAAHG